MQRNVASPRLASDLVGLDPGQTLLVTGPVLTNKRALVLSLLAGQDRPTAFVTTRKPATTVAREFARLDDGTDRLSVVDCTGIDDRRPDRTGRRETDRRRYVSGPGDLTGVGMALTGFMRRVHEAGGDGQVGLHSLSTMLMYADLKRVFQFLHVVVGRVEAAGLAGVFALDDGVVERREAAIVSQPFDAVVEVRDERGLQLRTRGAVDGPAEWTPVGWS